MAAKKTNPGIGHNSGMSADDWMRFEMMEGKRHLNEGVWRLAERLSAARERARYMRKGVIRPAYRTPSGDIGYHTPQLMVKNVDGSWSPEIKIVNNPLGGA